ncbi:MAG TPA: sulfite exporter TauE/SafE family protein [Tetrasphaera sp.]|uniref:sulfite exporter TauE/SafE family protein n=1 Tax=Nostocoides sp. TaxID=1917966 RepID=UPI002BE46113|nr:sulfite exporter TauE/SafE family protein [Tetrasphaera sp.]HNQ08220.1 sulfite exporter TauE/SafE family protein [Tetrasphaera sp.]
MGDLITADTPGLLAVAFAIGIVVGLTGMGGGALMTPALIFLGIPPTAAVANDLVAAAVNKSVGAAVHYKRGQPNLTLAKWLMIGSIPMAFAGGWIVKWMRDGDMDPETFLKKAIGCALLLTASTLTLRIYLEMRRGNYDHNRPDPPIKPIPTLIVGAVGGLLVGLTSVGSGSLIMISLLLLYPTLSARKLVGTDLVQAIPLVISAAISHVMATGITWSVLIPLIVGGSPGTFVGARLANFVSQSVLRRGIAIVLSLTGLGLLKVPPVWVGIIGAGLLLLGPIAWGMVKHAHGRRAFVHVPVGRRTGIRPPDSDPAPTPSAADTSERH